MAIRTFIPYFILFPKQVPKLDRIYHVDLKGRVSTAQDTSSLMLNPNGVGVDTNGNTMVGVFFLGNFHPFKVSATSSTF